VKILQVVCSVRLKIVSVWFVQLFQEELA